MPIKMSLGLKTRILQYICFFGTVSGIWIASPGGLWCSFFLYLFLQTFASNIALHRYFGHRAFTVSRPVENVFAVLATMIGVGSVVAWTAQHGHHHENSDTRHDVHSPHFQGVFRILFLLWNLNIIKKGNFRHLLRNPFIMFLHQHYFKIHFFYAAALCLVSPLWFIYGYCIPNTLCLLAGYALAIIDHWHGYQTYDNRDRSTNSWVANLLTLGEGWHNNHHHAPGRVRQGETFWQWDPPAWIIERLFVRSSVAAFSSPAEAGLVQVAAARSIGADAENRVRSDGNGPSL